MVRYKNFFATDRVSLGRCATVAVRVRMTYLGGDAMVILYDVIRYGNTTSWNVCLKVDA
jgi:hypothetical protein